MTSFLNRLTQTPVRSALLTAAVAAAAAGLTLTAAAMPGGHEHGAGSGGSGMPMMVMGNPEQQTRMLDSINATAEQRTQIQQILQASRTDMQAQRESRRAMHERSMQIFTQPTVDANAVEALRQQMLSQHEQASKRSMQAMVDVSRVLTVEQRKQLADRMGQREAMMQRHRAERGTLDKPAR